jgi:PAS domain S-box-containing protein
VTSEQKETILTFTYLPAFAQYIKDNYLVEFIREQLRLSKEIEVPMLKFFESMPEEQLIEMSKISASELLTFLEENKAGEQIESAINRWVTNQLPQVAREQIVAEDITLVHFIRKRSFLSFLPDYTADMRKLMEIIRELDQYMLASETAFTNMYMQLLKDRINEEVLFKEKISGTSPGNVYVYDIFSRKEIYSNEKINEKLGYSKEELKATGASLVTTIMHEEDEARLWSHMNELHSAHNGEIRTFEYRLRTKDGQYRWQRSYDSVFRRTAHGEVWQVIGISFDIQDEKNIAGQLQYSSEQLLEAQAMAEMGSYEWDLENNRGSSTPQVLKILETDREIDVQVFLSNIHPGDRPAVEEAFERSIRDHSLFDSEFRYIINGKEKVFWSRGSIFFNDGKPVMKGTLTDVTERHHMVKRLQRSEELYKQAQAITHIGNFSRDLRTNKITWSDELYRIYGVEPIGCPINQEFISGFYHPDDIEMVKEKILNSINTGEPYTFIYRINLKNGTLKALEAKGEILTDHMGKAYKIIGTAQDVTERQFLVERLQQTEEMYKKAEVLTHIGNWTWDLSIDNFTWTDELYRIFGLDPAQKIISFSRIVSLTHPDDRKKIENTAKSMIRTGQPHDIYYRIIRSDGIEKTLHSKGELQFDKNGKPKKMFGTVQDVTEEKETERRLRNNQNFIQKIADATPSIIASYNINTGKYVFLNKGLEKLLGYDPELALTQGVSFFINLIHPEDLGPLMEKNNKALELANSAITVPINEMIIEFQYRMRHKKGHYRWFHTFGTVFDRNATGKVEHVLNVSLDITERVEAEQVLFQKNLELQQSNASLEEMAYVASHDLQEPLRKISTFGDRLLHHQHKNLDDEGKTYLEKIITSSIRMQQLINDLLSISMISGEKNFEVYSLQDILAEVLQTLEYKIDERWAVIKAENLPEARIIPSQFRQLFQNLLSNSLKFVRPNVQPKIRIGYTYLSAKQVKEVKLAKADRYLQIEFSDNGIGFDKVFAEKIFTIFQRLHGRNVYEGTGIGLAICKKIIENHGGVIYASATQEKGASFFMIIPAE